MELLKPSPETHVSSDALLLAQVEQGNKQAFNTLYEKYWSWAHSTAFKRIKDHEHSKDIVQEIFIHIWLKRETHIDNLPAYLNRAILNRVIKYVGKQKLAHPFFDMLESIPDKKSHADANLLWKELFNSYETFLTGLPPKRQMIFRLRFQEGLPTRDIATELGLARKTVQNQLTKAIEHVRFFFNHQLIILIVCSLFL